MYRRLVVAGVMLVGCGGSQPVVPTKPPCLGELLTAGATTSWLRAPDGTIWQWGHELGASTASARGVVPADWAFGVGDLQHRGNHACTLSAAKEARCGTTPADLTLGAPFAAGASSLAVGITLDGELPAPYQACVIKADGSVWCGTSSGTSALATADVVEQVDLGREVAHLALQAQQGCAIKKDGTVWCWGRGYLGDGHARYAETDPPQPAVAVALPAAARTIASSTIATCVGLVDGNVHCFGQLAGNMVLAPSRIEVSDVEELGAGERHFCGKTSAGAVWCWGDNDHGEMARKPTESFDVWLPAEIPGVGEAASMVVGFRHACAGHADGTVSCWGGNLWGQSDPASAAHEVLVPAQVNGCATSRDGGAGS